VGERQNRTYGEIGQRTAAFAAADMLRNIDVGALVSAANLSWWKRALIWLRLMRRPMIVTGPRFEASEEPVRFHRPKLFGESLVSSHHRRMAETSREWRRALDQITLKEQPMQIELTITTIGNGVLARADFGHVRSGKSCEQDTYYPTPEAAFEALPELAAKAWGMAERNIDKYQPGDKVSWGRTHADRPDDLDRAKDAFASADLSGSNDLRGDNHDD
jgi:hypothetical protein